MLSLNHLRLLLIKEFIVIWRSKIWSVVEIAIPLVISVPLMILVLQVAYPLQLLLIFMNNVSKEFLKRGIYTKTTGRDMLMNRAVLELVIRQT